MNQRADRSSAILRERHLFIIATLALLLISFSKTPPQNEQGRHGQSMTFIQQGRATPSSIKYEGHPHFQQSPTLINFIVTVIVTINILGLIAVIYQETIP